MFDRKSLRKIDNYTWEIPKTHRKKMKVPARVYASQNMLDLITRDKSLEQLINIATLPGVEKFALAMPDVHQGYGSPVGGVIGVNLDKQGIISPGMVGFDINCGIRVLTTNIQANKIRDKIKDLAVCIQQDVPSGLGRGRKKSLNLEQINQILLKGPGFLVEQGIGEEQDLEHCEAGGSILEANPEFVSPKAKQRGADQVGTLGSGNHFLELQEVVQIFETETAKDFKLVKGQLVIMIHSGSRGLGHQVASDYIKKALQWTRSQGIWLADRELAYAPFKSSLGQQYFQAMAGAANFAWSNRHMMGHMVRQAFKKVIGGSVKLTTLYDVAHNIGKIEKHEGKQLLVHRKGATRAFGAKHPEVPEKYRAVGQPVLIPGSMGTSSWILVGDSRSEEKSFASACHGAGRVMSRTQAKREIQGDSLKKQLEQQGIVVQAGSMSGLAEEAPRAYKDVDEVVEIVHQVGLARKVAQLKPLAVIKG
jgi:tRNA-splicing ligase RtcB